ncbi:MAG: shikimate dehydrogenase [Erysipelotrichaceae bacterium]|nr:shikimate dehydrogenase [Erysipelotrichaceae bacterium]
MKYRLGLIAKDIKNSVNPYVYATYGKDLGEEVEFEIRNIPEEQLEAELEKTRTDWHGYHITMPYKIVAMKYMDELDESAVKCGSVNTVVVKEGKLVGYNTDGWGLVRCLKNNGVETEGKRIVMLGAGGVGSSIAYNLFINKVAHVDVVNIYLKQAQDLCDRYEGFDAYPLDYDTLTKLCKNADIFINASVMGQIGYDEFSDFTFLDAIGKDGVVFDVNYSNPDSLLVPEARKRGMRAWNGRGMTASQAIGACRLWFGKEPSLEAYKGILSHFEEIDKKQ